MSDDFALRLDEARQSCCAPTAVRSLADEWLRLLMATLFPHFDDPETEGWDSRSKLAMVQLRLRELILADGENPAHADAASAALMEALPQLRDDMIEDAKATERRDPASESLDEVIMAYPGFYAIATYRVAHVLAKQGVPLVPRLLTEHAHRETGIDVHPEAKIGVPFVIDHGTGVVIGQTTVIGRDVQLYQGVTLGALSVKKELAATKRHPTLEDGVVVYAGATILGGATVIGARSIVGGNAWITRSVPPDSIVTRDSDVRPRTSAEDVLVDFGSFI